MSSDRGITQLQDGRVECLHGARGIASDHIGFESLVGAKDHASILTRLDELDPARIRELGIDFTAGEALAGVARDLLELDIAPGLHALGISVAGNRGLEPVSPDLQNLAAQLGLGFGSNVLLNGDRFWLIGIRKQLRPAPGSTYPTGCRLDKDVAIQRCPVFFLLEQGRGGLDFRMFRGLDPDIAVEPEEPRLHSIFNAFRVADRSQLLERCRLWRKDCRVAMVIDKFFRSNRCFLIELNLNVPIELEIVCLLIVRTPPAADLFGGIARIRSVDDHIDIFKNAFVVFESQIRTRVHCK